MAVPFPQADLPKGISGGSDLWDSEAGVLLAEDYFDAAPAIDAKVSWIQLEVPAASGATGTQLKYWNGSAWVASTLKRWNGSAWVDAALKRWNGSAWVSV